MFEPVFTGIGQHDGIHGFGADLLLDILEYQLAADIYIACVAVSSSIFPGLQI
ncbi:hypothetical protein D3C76_1478390 [compost metagenome]